jgi:hypothetical protein
MKKLMEELIEEILLRLPPNEPAYLVRTALVCKSWHRILSDRGFHRRYRAFHRTPPLLGYYLHSLFYVYNPAIPLFVPTSTTVPPFITPLPLGPSKSWRAVDCRHGRVLLLRILDDPDDCSHLIVCDPVTGDQHRLSIPVYHPNGERYNGAVLCAADGCDHVDCHGGPFIVVFVVSGVDHVVRASMYSSETRAWGAPSSVDVGVRNGLNDRPNLLAQGALYFTLVRGGGSKSAVIKYDLRGHSLSVIDTPAGSFTQHMVMIKSEDGGLGFISVSDGCMYLWKRQQGGANGTAAGWVRHKFAQMKTLIPPELGGYRSKPRDVIGFEESTGTIFINRTSGVFAVDLKTRQVRMVGEGRPYPAILPYMSFYTPGKALFPFNMTTVLSFVASLLI